MISSVVKLSGEPIFLVTRVDGSCDIESAWHFGYNVIVEMTDDSPNGHGSCVASKAARWRNGVSKNSNIIMIKTSLSLIENNWALAEVLDNVLKKNYQGKSVVIDPNY